MLSPRWRRTASAQPARDSVTGLPLFALTEFATGPRRPALDVGAVLAVGVDNRAVVDHLLGPAAGDRLLADTAQRLQKLAAAHRALVRRVPEPGFIVVAPAASLVDLTRLAQSIAAIGWGASVEGVGRIVSPITVGMAVAPDIPHDVATLVRSASLALAKARADRPGTLMVFDEVLAAEAELEMSMGAALRRAIEEDAISLEFQPQVRLHDRAFVGVEALARWHDPELGRVSPATFVAVAEQIGMSRLLDQIVFEKVSAQIREWDAAGVHVPRVAVNCSPLTLASPMVARVASRLLDRFGVDPGRITIEVIESQLVESGIGLQNLAELRDLGVRISLDDFGTGYSSFGQLARLPVDEVKIDRSFVSGPDGPAGLSVASAIVNVAAAFGLEVVGEGIETAEQRDCLEELGCALGQGYLFSRPLPGAALGDWLREFDGAEGRMVGRDGGSA